MPTKTIVCDFKTYRRDAEMTQSKSNSCPYCFSLRFLCVSAPLRWGLVFECNRFGQPLSRYCRYPSACYNFSFFQGL
jgi:hypothetical protein